MGQSYVILGLAFKAEPFLLVHPKCHLLFSTYSALGYIIYKFERYDKQYVKFFSCNYCNYYLKAKCYTKIVYLLDILDIIGNS